MKKYIHYIIAGLVLLATASCKKSTNLEIPNPNVQDESARHNGAFGTPINFQAIAGTAQTAQQNKISFSSYHVGGCHALLMDGAVRFISDNIDAGTQRSLGTRNGGEVIGEF